MFIDSSVLSGVANETSASRGAPPGRSKPLHGPAQPVGQRDARPEAEQPLRLLDGSIRDRYVAGLRGLTVEKRLPAGRLLDRSDELRERDGVRASEVHDLEAGRRGPARERRLD